MDLHSMDSYTSEMDRVRLDGKTVIVTGCNTGIGKVTAKELARRGGRVIMACRNEQKALEAREDILKDPSIRPGLLVFMKLDLGSLKQIREFAENFNTNESRLDLLVNNAGVTVLERQLTVDDFEFHMGVNHLGAFLLTILLLDKLKASAPSRIVNVSSMGHRYGKIDFDDFQFEKGWASMASYSRSKAANVLFTVGLTKRLQGTGVTTYALHPGAVNTDLSRGFTSCMLFVLACTQCCCPCLWKSVEEGAQTSLYCCLEPKIANDSGKYYSDSREKTAASHATDPAIAEKLWTLSEELVGQKYGITKGF